MGKEERELIEAATDVFLDEYATCHDGSYGDNDSTGDAGGGRSRGNSDGDGEEGADCDGGGGGDRSVRGGRAASVHPIE